MLIDCLGEGRSNEQISYRPQIKQNKWFREICLFFTKGFFNL
jgi:hypothetical protein